MFWFPFEDKDTPKENNKNSQNSSLKSVVIKTEMWEEHKQNKHIQKHNLDKRISYEPLRISNSE